MPLLKNTRHETFAGLMANGMNQAEAYVAAGYSKGGADVSASKLARHPLVSVRITELRTTIAKTSAEKVGISKAWVLQSLRDNAEKAMQAEPVLDAQGNPTGEYRYEGGVVNRSLELIGKELGMFVDRKDVTMRRSIADLSDAEIDALIADSEQRKQDPSAASGSIQ